MELKSQVLLSKGIFIVYFKARERDADIEYLEVKHYFHRFLHMGIGLVRCR